MWKINRVTNTMYWELTREEEQALREQQMQDMRQSHQAHLEFEAQYKAEKDREAREALDLQWRKLRTNYPKEFDDELVLICMLTDDAARRVFEKKR